MAQATPVCATPIHICRVRVTRLTAAGAVSGSTKNSYTTSNPIQMTITPDVVTGTESDLIGGCDCIAATYRGYDKLRRFTLSLQVAAIEPALFDIMLGSTLVNDTSTLPVPIGFQWANQLTCTASQQPNVAIEAWSDLWSGDGPNAQYPYIKWVFPSTHWQIAALTLQNDFSPIQFDGFSRTNPAWNVGPYASDVAPVAVTGPGMAYYTTSIPSAGTCDYATAA